MVSGTSSLIFFECILYLIRSALITPQILVSLLHHYQTSNYGSFQNLHPVMTAHNISTRVLCTEPSAAVKLAIKGNLPVQSTWVLSVLGPKYVVSPQNYYQVLESNGNSMHCLWDSYDTERKTGRWVSFIWSSAFNLVVYCFQGELVLPQQQCYC